MKIIVFGATGGTGRLIVSQALAKGYAVTAFVRNANLLPQHPQLRTVEGDLFDFQAVAEAVRGQQAVLSALGPRTLKKTGLLAQAIPVILDAMRQESVQRLIVLGAAGVQRDYGKYQNALTRMAFWLVKHTRLKHPFADQAAQERLILASEADYTIVRAPRLSDTAPNTRYRVLPDALPPGALRIARADVADFMLQQLTDPRFHCQGPYIGAGGG